MHSEVRNLYNQLVKMAANHVTCQMGELGATLIKSGCLRVGLLASLTCVYSHMLSEIECLFEIFATDSALKVTFAM